MLLSTIVSLSDTGLIIHSRKIIKDIISITSQFFFTQAGSKPSAAADNYLICNITLNLCLCWISRRNLMRLSHSKPLSQPITQYNLVHGCKFLCSCPHIASHRVWQQRQHHRWAQQSWYRASILLRVPSSLLFRLKVRFHIFSWSSACAARMNKIKVAVELRPQCLIIHCIDSGTIEGRIYIAGTDVSILKCVKNRIQSHR